MILFLMHDDLGCKKYYNNCFDNNVSHNISYSPGDKEETFTTERTIYNLTYSNLSSLKTCLSYFELFLPPISVTNIVPRINISAWQDIFTVTRQIPLSTFVKQYQAITLDISSYLGLDNITAIQWVTQHTDVVVDQNVLVSQYAFGRFLLKNNPDSHIRNL